MLLIVYGKIPRVLLPVVVTMSASAGRPKLVRETSGADEYHRGAQFSVLEKMEWGRYAPFGTRRDLVELFPALFAEVLLWTGGFVHDADAPAMLPDLADIALDE